jgi:hypothetical protein
MPWVPPQDIGHFLNENLTTVSYNILMSIVGRIWGMKMITNRRISRYLARAIILLVMIIFVVTTVSCYPFLTLTIDSTEGGSVTAPGEGTFTYFSLQCCPLIRLVAAAQEDYRFVEWTSTGAVAGDFDKKSPDTYILLGGDGSVMAHFVRE